MPVFKYKAQKATGEVYEATREALDRFALYKDIKAEGDTVIVAGPVEKGGISFFTKLSVRFSGMNTKDKIMFARNLGTMLQAGLSLTKSLSVLERQSKKNGYKSVIQKISAETNKGKSLSEALKIFPSIFPPLFSSMVKAGEESGSLPQALNTVSEQMNGNYLLQKKIRGAMIYPAIIITLMIAIGILMLIYVVPTISAVFKQQNIDLPWNTQLIILTSQAIKDHVVIFASALVVAIFGGYLFKKSASGKKILDSVYLKLPAIGILVKEANSARTARTLASLLSAGVDVVQSIEITSDVVQNHYFKNVLAKAKERIKKGDPVSAVFGENDKLYPIFFAEMVNIGEETGKLSEMLINVAVYYESEVEQTTKDLSTIVEPVLMIVIGCAVAFFAISIISPIYSIGNAI